MTVEMDDVIAIGSLLQLLFQLGEGGRSQHIESHWPPLRAHPFDQGAGEGVITDITVAIRSGND
jgi:hypothetical protein